MDEERKLMTTTKRARGFISSSSFFPHLAFILLDGASDERELPSSRFQSATLHSSTPQLSLVPAAMAPRQGQRTMDAYGTARRRAAGPTPIAGDGGAAALMGKVRSFVRRSPFLFLFFVYFYLAVESRHASALSETRRKTAKELLPVAIGLSLISTLPFENLASCSSLSLKLSSSPAFSLIQLALFLDPNNNAGCRREVI